jgi:hypothetical protein
LNRGAALAGDGSGASWRNCGGVAGVLGVIRAEIGRIAADGIARGGIAAPLLADAPLPAVFAALLLVLLLVLPDNSELLSA